MAMLTLFGIFVFLLLLPYLLRWWPVRFAAYAIAAALFVMAVPMLPTLWRGILNNPAGEGTFFLLFIGLAAVIASGAIFEIYSRLRYGRWLVDDGEV